MEYLNQIMQIYNKLRQKESLKNLSFFLLINLFFMFVEVLYGLISNSLGLLTDGAHMLLDCSAIIIGLYSSYLSDNKPDSKFNFGYQRSEVLGTFINSVFLIFVSLYIVFESIERFINPKEIHADHLILISFLGLVVNLIGIYYLHGEHGHGHGNDDHGHSHGCSHGHSHSSNHDVEAGHTHSNHSDHSNSGSEYNENLYAIYIHIIADALGSVSVLISSFLIRYYKLYFTDPLCSLFISIMIIYSAWPVLKSSSFTLLHYFPEGVESLQNKIEKAEERISICYINLWKMSKNYSVCELKINLNDTDDCNKSEIQRKVGQILKENKINEAYIELC
jgi:zinc transporter 5/7